MQPQLINLQRPYSNKATFQFQMDKNFWDAVQPTYTHQSLPLAAGVDLPSHRPPAPFRCRLRPHCVPSLADHPSKGSFYSPGSQTLLPTQGWPALLPQLGAFSGSCPGGWNPSRTRSPGPTCCSNAPGENSHCALPIPWILSGKDSYRP